MTTNWNHLHQLTENAARYAPAWPPNFGGTGPHCHVEETTFGLAKLYDRAGEALHQAWDQLHKCSKTASVDRLREMIYFALAAGKLHRAVVEALGGTPSDYTICYVADVGRGGAQLMVQGLRWRWYSTDLGFVPAEAAEAFAAGGPLDDLKDALDATAHITDGYENMGG